MSMDVLKFLTPLITVPCRLSKHSQSKSSSLLNAAREGWERKHWKVFCWMCLCWISSVSRTHHWTFQKNIAWRKAVTDPTVQEMNKTCQMMNWKRRWASVKVPGGISDPVCEFTIMFINLNLIYSLTHHLFLLLFLHLFLYFSFVLLITLVNNVSFLCPF